MMLYILLLSLALANLSICQNTCPALAATACNIVDRPKGDKRLRCGVYGIAKHPNLVQDACLAANFNDCREYCLSTPVCHSFSFAETEIKAGNCSLFTGSVVSQGFHYDNTSIEQFYNRHCYKYNCPRVGCPSQDFNLQVTNKKSKYFKYLVQRVTSVLDFTSDVTQATAFFLDEDCQINSKGHIGSDGVTMTNPDVVNGPLYFYHNATTQAMNYALPQCTVDTGNFQLSCNYSAAGGSGDESFYSCNSVVSLGTFPGSPPCQAADTPISLTAFSFG